MRMLMAFLAIGTTMAFVSFQRWWQRILLIGSAFPVALVVNIVRVLVLGLLSLIDPDLGTGEVHTMVGVFLLVPAWLLFLGVAEILKRLVIDPSDDALSWGLHHESASTSSITTTCHLGCCGTGGGFTSWHELRHGRIEHSP